MNEFSTQQASKKIPFPFEPTSGAAGMTRSPYVYTHASSHLGLLPEIIITPETARGVTASAEPLVKSFCISGAFSAFQEPIPFHWCIYTKMKPYF